jgi:hypothetical protein
MNPISRVLTEYRALSRVLSFDDFVALSFATLKEAPEVLRTKKLTGIDAAMSRNINIRFRGHKIAVPLAEIDPMLVPLNDNPTFGNLREMCARDCYFQRLDLRPPIGVVLDLGANRGLFSLLALLVLNAEKVIGVEPHSKYEPVVKLLLEANHCKPSASVRYSKFVTSPSAEQRDPINNVSIKSILQEQRIDTFGFVKMDIEGFEKDLFSEPEWLSSVNNIAMELHQHVGDLSLIPRALERYNFRYEATDQFGHSCAIDQAMFLYASRTGALTN